MKIIPARLSRHEYLDTQIARSRSKFQHCKVSMLETVGGGSKSRLGLRSLAGVEISPDAERLNVLIGSFDEMPERWAGRLGVVVLQLVRSVSGSAAHGGCRAGDPPGRPPDRVPRSRSGPNVHDSVDQLALGDVHELFGGEFVCFRHRGSRKCYSEAILRMSGGRSEP
jgi:hypothetical protein